MIILGAGLAGCLAGALNNHADIYEANGDMNSHQAVLRFRTPDIGIALGIPFKEVRVYKDIWDGDGSIFLTPLNINQYSKKVSGIISARSIINQETETRWIAPPDFLDLLKKQCGPIKYNTKIDRNFIKDCQATGESIISTIPLSVMTGLVGLNSIDTTNSFSSIFVNHWHVNNCDVYQTIYYPAFNTRVYRASITKDLLILESTASISPLMMEDMLCESFGLERDDIELILEDHEQKIGKMIPIDEAKRRKAIIDLTLTHGIFSLGRFATWRNLLLDDVYKDILHIKKMIHKDQYHHYLEYMKNESRTT